MRRIELDGRQMDTRDQLHRYLQQQLALPDYYGRNLDALQDCLGEMAQVEITLTYAQAMLNSLGIYGQKLLQVFEREAASRSDFRFLQRQA